MLSEGLLLEQQHFLGVAERERPPDVCDLIRVEDGGEEKLLQLRLGV